MSSGHRSGEGEIVSRLLDDAIIGVPLPQPWQEVRTEDGSVFYNNEATAESSWDHPLSQELQQLSPLLLRCLALQIPERGQAAKLLRQRFQVEAEKAYKRWYSAEDGQGNYYFCNNQTGESMWEHPASVILPAFYLKIRTVELLLDEEYLQGLGADQDETPSERSTPRPGRLSRTLSRILGRVNSLTSSEGLPGGRPPRLNSKEVGSPCKVPTCISTSSCSTASFADIDGAFAPGLEDGEESEISEVPEIALLVESWACEEP
mmetsp:Transcript_60179/g.140645  ORF Transcript_60179/g.140645 Transcript_60179/m.140645 type:complete len:262 (-) Transcript_60179:7-792(-)